MENIGEESSDLYDNILSEDLQSVDDLLRQADLLLSSMSTPNLSQLDSFESNESSIDTTELLNANISPISITLDLNDQSSGVESCVISSVIDTPINRSTASDDVIFIGNTNLDINPAARRNRRRNRQSELMVTDMIDLCSPEPANKRLRETISSTDRAPEPTTSKVPADVARAPNLELICSICLDSPIGKNPVSTLCGHIYCRSCIQQHMRFVKKCPMCRTNIRGAHGFHAIHL